MSADLSVGNDNESERPEQMSDRQSVDEKKVSVKVGTASDGVDAFIRDIEPFFYRQNINYVDVGAFEGKVFAQMLASNLSIGEAHLIEPNPETFSVLKVQAEEVFDKRSLNLYNVAVGEQSKRVSMKAARTMTRVIDDAATKELATQENSNTFTVACLTLDEMANSFTNKRVSILKIDVEGYEAQALAGASQLLSEQRVDVIYIEAGGDPLSTQQTYYRIIDDIMLSHGYRLFRIYEQMHEWMDDSPFLRRMNLAYFSSRFAESRPYRLTREVFKLQGKYGALQEKYGVQKQKIANLHSKIEKLELQINGMREALSIRDRSIKQMAKEVEAVRSSASWRITAPLRRLKRRLNRLFSSNGETRPRSSRSQGKSVGAAKKSKDGTDPSHRRAKRLEDKLWGGFSRYALEELEALKSSKGADVSEVSKASWALACWFAGEGSFERARDNARLAWNLATTESEKLKARLLDAFCLVRIGDTDASRDILNDALKMHPQDPNLHLAMANTYAPSVEESSFETDDIRLFWINRVYEMAGLLPLKKLDSNHVLSVGNLMAASFLKTAVKEQPKVTVIMPVYNAQETLGFALRGLIEQTWENLEIIVVDDKSTDDTAEVAEDFARRDPRIKVIRQETNLGSYSARNRALEFATGEFITVHDSNDWSHPQKIELQATHLLKHPSMVGNYTRWSRAFWNMLFVGKFRRKDKIIDWNPSSFLFRRSVLDKVGGWDPVRISADAEFFRRAKKCSPPDSIVSAFDAAPLAFALDVPQSLTKYSATHGRTIHHGLRRAYQEAANYWLETSQVKNLKIDRNVKTRRFPVPGPILPQRQSHATCDILLVTDFNSVGKELDLAVSYLQSASVKKQKVALFHWPRYESDVTAPLNNRIREMALAGKMDVIAPGERVEASIVIVGRSDILRFAVDLFPEVKLEQLFVIDTLQQQSGAKQPSGSNPEIAQKNLIELFGSPGKWITVNDSKDLIQQTMPPVKRL